MSVTSMGEARRNQGRRGRTRASAGPSLTTFVTSWQLALEAASKSNRTIRSYLDSVRNLYAFLVDQQMPSDVEGVDAAHIRAFLLAEERRTSPQSNALAGSRARHHPQRLRAPPSRPRASGRR